MPSVAVANRVPKRRHAPTGLHKEEALHLSRRVLRTGAQVTGRAHARRNKETGSIDSDLQRSRPKKAFPAKFFPGACAVYGDPRADAREQGSTPRAEELAQQGGRLVSQQAALHLDAMVVAFRNQCVEHAT